MVSEGNKSKGWDIVTLFIDMGKKLAVRYGGSCDEMSLRSFNPNLISIGFKQRSKSSLRNFVDKYACQDIIDKLDLKQKYQDPSKLNIVDIYSGFGLLSTMINYELTPKKHILIENHYSTIPHYEKILPLINQNPNSEIIHYVKSGYDWDTYKHLTDTDKLLDVSKQSRDKIHDELLIIANVLSHSFAESLFAQWLLCIAHENWLQRFGRVRMICIIPEATAQKFLAGPGFFRRNKGSVKRDIYSDCKLIAINESGGDNHQPDGWGYDPNVLINDQPIIIPITAVQPATLRYAVVEVVPKALPNVNVESLEFVSQILMYKRSHPIFEGLKFVSPGALEDLGPKLQHLAHKTPRDLTADEFKYIVDVFEKWPFKPNFEDILGLSSEPDDH